MSFLAFEALMLLGALFVGAAVMAAISGLTCQETSEPESICGDATTASLLSETNGVNEEDEESGAFHKGFRSHLTSWEWLLDESTQHRQGRKREIMMLCGGSNCL